MYKQDDNLPIGALLKKAGLISEAKIQDALKIQSQYTNMRLGEILVLQGSVHKNTISFFIEQWDDAKKQGKQFPIGYYFRKAALLNDRQIKRILTEQKKSNLKFGTVAVRKGWIEQDTLDFFINNLTTKPIKLVSLSTLEKYNNKILHLEKKSHNPQAILKEVLFWTGGNPILTKILCQLIVNVEAFIPRGIEKITVKNLVINSLINNWKNRTTAEYIRSIEYSVINNVRCDAVSLLKLYRKILLRGEIKADNSPEQEELLILGLAVKKDNKLQLGNQIYQYTFNPGWIEKQLLELRQSTHPPNLLSSELDKIEPITKLSSIVTLLSIGVLTPLIIINNNDARSQTDLTAYRNLPANFEQILESCDSTVSVASSNFLETMTQLERGKQILKDDFPKSCETVLHQLWVLTAPTLGKQDRVLEATNNLCKIPPNSDSFNSARLWIDRWSASPDWGEQLQSYFNLVSVSNCPAAK